MTKRKLLCTGTAFLLCVVNVPNLLYLYAKHSMPVTSKMTGQPLCRPFNQTSFYNISTEVVSWETIENEIKNLEPGGHFTPKDCISQWRVAIIVPYRDRKNHLKVFLRNIHPFLQQQQLDYGIFVIEMPPATAFNRGLLMNVGFKESCRLYNYNCFIFHDVDLLPETMRNVYNCNDHPKHLSSAIDTRRYKLSYKTNFGGVTAISKEQFTVVNGFSNEYFGWGREDDDLYHRLIQDGTNLEEREACGFEMSCLRTIIVNKRGEGASMHTDYTKTLFEGVDIIMPGAIIRKVDTKMFVVTSDDNEAGENIYGYVVSVGSGNRLVWKKYGKNLGQIFNRKSHVPRTKP